MFSTPNLSDTGQQPDPFQSESLTSGFMAAWKLWHTVPAQHEGEHLHTAYTYILSLPIITPLWWARLGFFKKQYKSIVKLSTQEIIG